MNVYPNAKQSIIHVNSTLQFSMTGNEMSLSICSTGKFLTKNRISHQLGKEIVHCPIDLNALEMQG